MGFLSISVLYILALLAILLLKALHVVVRRTAKSQRPKLPPGPRPLPIIGNLFDLGDKPHISFAALAKTYGPLMSLKLGSITTIVVSSSELAEDILHKHDINFCDRSVPDAINAKNHSQVSVAWSPVSAFWRNLRRICNSYIFTPQKLDSNQELRNTKIREMLAEVQESSVSGGTVEIGAMVYRVVVNIMLNVMFSLNLTDSRSHLALEFKEFASGALNEAGKPNFSDYFPILRKFDPQGIRRRTAVLFSKLLDIIDQMIEERLLLRKSDGYATKIDMLEALLTICEQEEEMDRTTIKHLLLDLFVAGTDTTSITAEWAMAELLRNPVSLRRVRSELEQIVGKGKLLQESDINRLPYLKAVLKETLRLHPAVPFLLPRKARSDIEMRGFIIPKGAQVLVNVWAIGRDPNLWEDPNSFTPERFLNSEIEERGRSFELIPFGAGRRICPGLPMATRMLPMILGSLIHLFDWKLEDWAEPESMDMEDKLGLTLQKAKPLRAVAVQVQKVLSLI